MRKACSFREKKGEDRQPTSGPAHPVFTRVGQRSGDALSTEREREREREREERERDRERERERDREKFIDNQGGRSLLTINR